MIRLKKSPMKSQTTKHFKMLNHLLDRHKKSVSKIILGVCVLTQLKADRSHPQHYPHKPSERKIPWSGLVMAKACPKHTVFSEYYTA